MRDKDWEPWYEDDAVEEALDRFDVPSDCTIVTLSPDQIVRLFSGKVVSIPVDSQMDRMVDEVEEKPTHGAVVRVRKHPEVEKDE